jgi:hypothetical protein
MEFTQTIRKTLLTTEKDIRQHWRYASETLKMKKTYVLIIFTLTTFFCFSQQKYKVTYNQLKEYEGLYEYLNNTTLKIAASPVDTILLCIINESRYPSVVDKVFGC